MEGIEFSILKFVRNRARRGLARRGLARQGEARLGSARHGKARHGLLGAKAQKVRGSARLGEARRGWVRLGMVLTSKKGKRMNISAISNYTRTSSADLPRFLSSTDLAVASVAGGIISYMACYATCMASSNAATSGALLPATQLFCQQLCLPLLAAPCP